MNAILLKTDRGEYHPGEEVFGIVLLHIISPTSGRGIKLNISISEQVVFNFVGEDSYLNRVNERIVYLEENTVLYEDEYPLLLGDYSFPFKFTIPENVPGSFFSFKGKNPSWKASIECMIMASVIESERLTYFQPVVILNCSRLDIENRSFVDTKTTLYSVFSVPALLRGQKKGICITSKLLDNIYRSGECIRFRVVIGNNCDLHIVSFRIKLLRNLVFKTRSGCNKDEQRSLEQCLLYPEKGPCILWEKFGIIDKDTSLMNSVLDNLLIPLKELDGTPVIPSSCGKYIECKYGIEVIFTLSNKDVMTINHPVVSILPLRNRMWESLVLPKWCKSATVTKCESSLSPTGSELAKNQSLNGNNGHLKAMAYF